MFKYNVLELTNPSKFHNTNLIPGTTRTLHECSIFGKADMHGQFCGYVFRGDTRPPEIIFSQGFMLQKPIESVNHLRCATGYQDNQSFEYGVSTSAGVYVASHYVTKYDYDGVNHTPSSSFGYVYLIDATCMIGFHMPDLGTLTDGRMNEGDLASLRDVDIAEVNFPCSIPNSLVIGMVTMPDEVSPITSGPISLPAGHNLKLFVNPMYQKFFKKGLSAAEDVAGLFNNAETDFIDF